MRGSPSKCRRYSRHLEAKSLRNRSPYQTHEEHTKSQFSWPDKTQTSSRQKCLAICLAVTLHKFPTSDKIKGSPSGHLSTTQFIRLADVKSMTGLSKSTIYLWMAQKKFPRQISIANRLVVWEENCDPRLDASAGCSQRISP